MGFSDGWDPARPGAVAGPGESVFCDELAAEICEAVAAGRSLRAFCAEPGRPHRTTVRNWRRTHPDFGAAMGAAYLLARGAERRRDRALAAARRQAAAEAAQVDGAPADRTLAAGTLADGTLMDAALADGAPAEGAPGGARRGGRPSAYTPEIGEAVCERLEAGESLAAIGADPAMPSRGVVLKWVKAFPEFEARYALAREVQGDALFDAAGDVAREATRADVPVARLKFDVIRWQTARLAPKKYLERVVASEVKAEAEKAERARTAAEDRPRRVIFHATHFEVAPDGKTVLAAPPRNPAEAQKWVTATGRPYEPGVGPRGQIRPPAIPEVGEA